LYITENIASLSRKRASLCLSVSVRMAVGLRGLSVNILMLTDEQAPRCSFVYSR